MNCPGNQSPGLWTHPNDRSDHYKNIDHWIELAKTLEAARFDGVFFADVLGPYDVYQNSRDAGLRQAVQSPINDPLLIIPAMAAVTKQLGFGVTASVTHEHPYIFARRMSTLDHLTQGRIGWNIVTSYLKRDRKSTRLNSSHVAISYAVFCLKKKKNSDDNNDGKSP